MLRDFPYSIALFGLVSYNDPCTLGDLISWSWRLGWNWKAGFKMDAGALRVWGPSGWIFLGEGFRYVIKLNELGIFWGWLGQSSHEPQGKNGDVGNPSKMTWDVFFWFYCSVLWVSYVRFADYCLVFHDLVSQQMLMANRHLRQGRVVSIRNKHNFRVWFAMYIVPSLKLT